jgi:hypothetical protein
LRAIDRSTTVVTEDGRRSLLSSDRVEVDGIDVHRHDGRDVRVAAIGGDLMGIRNYSSDSSCPVCRECCLGEDIM